VQLKTGLSFMRDRLFALEALEWFAEAVPADNLSSSGTYGTQTGIAIPGESSTELS